MELDLNNPTVQVAFIAAVAAVATAMFSLLAALVTAFVTLFNHMFEARAKRLEKIKDVRSEKAQQLLEDVAEMHSDLAHCLQLVGFLRLDFIFLIVESEENTQVQRFAKFNASIQDPTSASTNKAIVDATERELRKLSNWFNPKIVSSLFWFPRPLQLKSKLEALISEARSVYFILIGELYNLRKLEERISKIDQSAPIPKDIEREILKIHENKLLEEWQNKAFKTVLEVQRLLAPHMR